MVLTLDEPGTKSDLGKDDLNKKGETVWKETNYFAMDVRGSGDIPANTVTEVLMDDPNEQEKAAKSGTAKLPLGRYSLRPIPHAAPDKTRLSCLHMCTFLPAQSVDGQTELHTKP